jgi:hypothetical protein
VGVTKNNVSSKNLVPFVFIIFSLGGGPAFRCVVPTIDLAAPPMIPLEQLILWLIGLACGFVLEVVFEFAFEFSFEF